MGDDVSEAEVPVQVSPLVPETVHDAVSVVDQVICVGLPEPTRRGEAEIDPVIALYKQVAEPGEQNCGAVQLA